MPLYEYVCNNCEQKKDIIVKLEERDEPRKCDCGNGDLVRDENLHAAGLHFKGMWYKTAKGY